MKTASPKPTTSVARRQQAAQEREVELQKMNAALQASIEALAHEPALESFVPIVLRVAAETFGAASCSFFEVDESETIFLRYVYHQGRVITPMELPLLDETKFGTLKRLADGFTVPVEHLGVHPTRRKCSVVLDHRKAKQPTEFNTFAISVGWELELNIPLLVGDETRGAFLIHRSGDATFSPSDISLAESLGRQLTLAMQATRNAEKEREAAVACEREQAAQQRAEELERMARALQETIDSFGKISALDELVPVVLQIVARTLGAASCAVFEHKADHVFLKYWFVEGRVLHPHELLEVDPQKFGLIRTLACGFTVPVDYLGTTVHERTRAVVVDHAAGTSVPEFDIFARDLGWDLELNVPIVSDSRAIGALCVYRNKGAGEYTPQEIRFAESLSAQLAMAMLAKDLAAQAQERAIETVVAREREQAAQQRAEELSKANEVLRRGADQLVGSGDIQEFLNLSLSEAVRITGANSGALFILTGNGTEMTLKAHCPALPLEGYAGLSDKMAITSLNDTEGIFCDLLAGEFTRVNLQDESFARIFPEAVRYHKEQGNQVGWHLTLRVSGRSIGFMGLAFKTAPPNDSMRESLKAQIQQIALALELTRLGEDAKRLAVTKEKKRAAEERVAELARANATMARSLAAVSQSTDFDDTLEKVFFEIVTAANACAGQLFLYETRANTLATIVWTDETGHGRGFCPDSPPLLRTAFDADITPAFRLSLQAKDVFGINFKSFTSEEATLVWPGTTEWHLARGRESACAIPILVGQRPIGVIGLAWKEQFSFSPEQRELLFALTNQAAMVMQLRELADSQSTAVVAREREQAAQQRAAELAQSNELLRRVNERLAHETNYRSVLGLLLAELSSLVGNDSAAIFAFDPSEDSLRFLLGFENGSIVEELIGHPYGRADKPVPVRLFPAWPDLVKNRSQQFINMSLDSAAPPSNAWHRAHGHRLLVQSVLVANGEPLGLLGLAFTSDAELDPAKVELFNAVAQQATLALQLSRLSDQARLADVARERETTVLQERARFAGQIHDTLAQGFTGTLLHLEALRVRTARGERVTVDELQSVRKIAALGLAEARRSALAIRPLALDGRDLSTALQQLTERSAVPGLLDCRWSLGGVPRPLPPLADEALLNIAHEAVSNAIRHADASNIHITLAFDSDGVTLRVRDDGIGFDASDSRQRGHTFGLRSMRERATVVGGSLDVHSKHGEGTTVTVHLATA